MSIFEIQGYTITSAIFPSLCERAETWAELETLAKYIDHRETVGFSPDLVAMMRQTLLSKARKFKREANHYFDRYVTAIERGDDEVSAVYTENINMPVSWGYVQDTIGWSPE